MDLSQKMCQIGVKGVMIMLQLYLLFGPNDLVFCEVSCIYLLSGHGIEQ